MEWKDIATHDDNCIMGFFGDYRYLSNFHPCNVVFEGVDYPSSENAYMAAKCKDKTQREQFKTLAPKEAKAEGRKVALRDDWETVKLNIMFDVLKSKFKENVGLRQRLVATGTKYLEETNWWGDTYWGVCKMEGKNNLGKLLMKVRDGINQGLW